MQLDHKKKACLCLYSFLVLLPSDDIFLKDLSPRTDFTSLTGWNSKTPWAASNSCTFSIINCMELSGTFTHMYYIETDQITEFFQWWEFLMQCRYNVLIIFHLSRYFRIRNFFLPDSKISASTRYVFTAYSYRIRPSTRIRIHSGFTEDWQNCPPGTGSSRSHPESSKTALLSHSFKLFLPAVLSSR